MSRVGLVLGAVVAVVVVVGVSEYAFDLPFDVWRTSSQPYGAPRADSTSGNTNVPRYSNVRGLQDAPRDDVAQGGAIDLKRCLNTMNLRGLKPDVAQHTCNAIIDGISG